MIAVGEGSYSRIGKGDAARRLAVRAGDLRLRDFIPPCFILIETKKPAPQVLVDCAAEKYRSKILRIRLRRSASSASMRAGPSASSNPMRRASGRRPAAEVGMAQDGWSLSMRSRFSRRDRNR